MGVEGPQFIQQAVSPIHFLRSRLSPEHSPGHRVSLGSPALFFILIHPSLIPARQIAHCCSFDYISSLLSRSVFPEFAQTSSVVAKGGGRLKEVFSPEMQPSTTEEMIKSGGDKALSLG